MVVELIELLVLLTSSRTALRTVSRATLLKIPRFRRAASAGEKGKAEMKLAAIARAKTASL